MKTWRTEITHVLALKIRPKRAAEIIVPRRIMEVASGARNARQEVALLTRHIRRSEMRRRRLRSKARGGPSYIPSVSSHM